MSFGYTPLSAIDRKITACPEYDKFFDIPQQGKTLKKRVLNPDGDVKETVDEMLAIVNKYYKEVDRAKHLVKGENIHQTAENIFNWLFRHIKYNLERGEILNTPSASYYLGQVKARQNPDTTSDFPVDCDDFSIFAASFLKSLGLPWGFRIASYDGVKFSHVYCIVPLPEGNEIIIDPVYHTFNAEKPYIKEKTFIGNLKLSGMKITYQGVSGNGRLGQLAQIASYGAVYNPQIEQIKYELAGGVHFAHEFQGVDGLSGFEDDNTDMALKSYLNDTLRVAKANPMSVRGGYCGQPQEFITMLEGFLGSFDNEEDEIMNAIISSERELIAKQNSAGISGFNGIGEIEDVSYHPTHPDYTTYEIPGVTYRYEGTRRYFSGLTGFFGALGLFKRLRKFMKKAGKKIGGAVRKVAKKVGGAAQKVRHGIRKIGTGIKRVGKKVWTGVKKVAKKVGKFIMKINPATLLLRNAFRLLVAVNFRGLAQLLKQTPKIFDKVVNMYEKMGGDSSKIKKAINNGSDRKALFGKSKQLKGIDEPDIRYVDDIHDIYNLEGIANINAGTIHLEGFGELGEALTVGGAVAAGGGLAAKVFSWLKGAGKKVIDVAKKVGGVVKKVVKKVIQKKPVTTGAGQNPAGGGFINKAFNFVKNKVLLPPQQSGGQVPQYEEQVPTSEGYQMQTTLPGGGGSNQMRSFSPVISSNNSGGGDRSYNPQLTTETPADKKKKLIKRVLIGGGIAVVIGGITYAIVKSSKGKRKLVQQPSRGFAGVKAKKLK